MGLLHQFTSKQGVVVPSCLKTVSFIESERPRLTYTSKQAGHVLRIPSMCSTL